MHPAEEPRDPAACAAHGRRHAGKGALMAGACVRTGVAGLLACAVFVSVAAPASVQGEERSRARVRPPAELLKEYPFDQGRLRSRQRSGTRTTPRPVDRSARSGVPSGDGGGGSPVVWLAFAGVVLLAMLGLIARRARRPAVAGASSPEVAARTARVKEPVPERGVAGAAGAEVAARTAGVEEQPV